MRGPQSVEKVSLSQADPPELLWITGYQTEVVEAERHEPLSQEFMCHANLDLPMSDYRTRINSDLDFSERVFTLSQGQQSIELPPGFGIPIMSNVPLNLNTQVLNLNQESPDLLVQHRVRVSFTPDSALEEKPRALFMVPVEALKAEEEGSDFGFHPQDPEMPGPGCGVGLNADVHQRTISDELNQSFIPHWVVPPGREVTKTTVTRRLNLPFDTTVHYIAVHLHPTAESLELVDLTTMESVFRAGVVPAEGRLGIQQVDHFSSVTGLPLYQDHEYGIISTYDNQTGEPVDSMAVMYLYLADPNFQKPEPPEQVDPESKLGVEPPPRSKRVDHSTKFLPKGVSYTVVYESAAKTTEVIEHYRASLKDTEWNGPDLLGNGQGGFWSLGRPVSPTLGDFVRPHFKNKEAGLLWVWPQEDGSGCRISCSRYHPY